MNSIELLKSVLVISTSGTTAAAVINHVVSRERNRKIEKVSRLVDICGNGTSRQAVIGVLKQLEDSGFGRFIIGRRGYDSRFVWKEV